MNPAAAYRRLSGAAKTVSFGITTFEMPADGAAAEPELEARAGAEALAVFDPLTSPEQREHLQR